MVYAPLQCIPLVLTLNFNEMKPIAYILICLTMLSFTGCSKFLDAKPDERLATIATIKDMQALLDNYATLNYSDPAMGEVYGDNYFLTNEVFNARDEYDRNMYTFASSNIFKPKTNVWNNVYTQVNIANTVVQAANDHRQQLNDETAIRHIIAQSLFFRGKAFYHALSLWTMPYKADVAEKSLGIPLRLNANFSEPSVRSNVAKSYQQVINDFQNCISALPKIATTPARASKAAAYGMLSRVYLQLRDYENARKYADSTLQIQNTLLNYNTLNAAANFPVPKLNVEIVFEGRAETASHLVQARAFINPQLYQLYAANDLRKTVFFRASGSNFLFKGNYQGAATFFNGITTAEMKLTRAECNIRANKVEEGLAELNELLINRFKTGNYTPVVGLSKEDALQLVKSERRKELIFRCMRWLDMKRFNEEGDEISLTRVVNGKTYTLEPRSKANALAIPEDVIELSGMQQNER
jgi:tetratricopeptide (TPR) repeat protein